MSEIKHILGLSGGKDSAAIAVHMNKKYPDLTLLLNVNPKIGLARKNKISFDENRFENFKEENCNITIYSQFCNKYVVKDFPYLKFHWNMILIMDNYKSYRIFCGK